MTASTDDPRVLRACWWFFQHGWIIDIDHQKGTAMAFYNRPGAQIDIVSLVFADPPPAFWDGWKKGVKAR